MHIPKYPDPDSRNPTVASLLTVYVFPSLVGSFDDDMTSFTIVEHDLYATRRHRAKPNDFSGISEQLKSVFPQEVHGMLRKSLSNDEKDIKPNGSLSMASFTLSLWNPRFS